MLHGVDDFHLFGFLYLLTIVFTREFYIRLNKWDKEQQSLSAIVANTARLPINEVKPDEFTPEGMEIAERLYYVFGWILTAGKRRKQSSIVTIRKLHLGKKHSIPDSMPTQLVDEAQCFEGGLVYPKESFFFIYVLLRGDLQDCVTTSEHCFIWKQAISKTAVHLVAL